MKNKKSLQFKSTFVCPVTGKIIVKKRQNLWCILIFPIIGLLSLVWFLIRVIPKPSRATYPCQRAAAPIASAFVLWVIGLLSILYSWKIKKGIRRLGFLICIVLFLSVVGLPSELSNAATGNSVVNDSNYITMKNIPIGIAKGINPGRVTWAYNPKATLWDGKSIYWWSYKNTDPVVVDDMMSRSLQALTGKSNDTDSWDILFKYFNKIHSNVNEGYKKGEKIAIKLNINNGGYKWYTYPAINPQIVLALIKQLVNVAGVNQSDITFYDASQDLGDPIFNLCKKSFPMVNFADKSGNYNRIKSEPDKTIPVFFSSKEITVSGKMYLPTYVTEAKYLIDLANLKGHILTGMTVCAKNYFGSLWDDNISRWTPENLHQSVAANAMDSINIIKHLMGTYNSFVDLLGNKNLGGKTLLYIIDGLYSAIGADKMYTKWQSKPFDGGWTSSIFLSQDPVAIDSVAYDLIVNEPTELFIKGSAGDNYLHEAALANNPPSKIFYDPDKTGKRLGSLGVHEHWNNALEKKYSRNLSKNGKGIDLYQILFYK